MLNTSLSELQTRDPEQVRQAIRAGRWAGQTAGLADGYVQTNLVVLPGDEARDFERFCELNPKPCPLLDMTEPGSPVPQRLAPESDLRTDLPRYRIYESGQLVDEPTDITDYWRDDMVAFLLGCSYTFEHGLIEAGVPMRHIDRGRGVPMYRTSRPCTPAGRFSGPLVVSMRPIPNEMVELAGEVTTRYPEVHGGPVHAGDPEELGIVDLDQPDWGDPPIFMDGDVPVFWACGVTPQAVAIESRPALMITHAPGHMFITDFTVKQLEQSR